MTTNIRPLLYKDFQAWWGTGRWWTQALLWTVILNGLLALFLWVLPNVAQHEVAIDLDVLEAVLGFLSFMGTLAPIGIVVSVAGTFIDEKHNGLLELLLSKPVSRASVVLSQYAAHAVGFFFTVIVLQGVLAYVQISLAAGQPWFTLPFAAAMLVLAVNMLFYLSLAFALAIFTGSRGVVIGVPLALLLGYQIILGALPQLSYFTPYGLVQSPASSDSGPLAAMLALGEPVQGLQPLLATVVWIALLLGAAIWRFRREEF